MNSAFMFDDTPSARDLLDFHRYADPLIKIIRNPRTETPFTIGVFGPWGAGKSTLLGYLRKELEKTDGSPVNVCIDFNPWIYRVLRPLLAFILDFTPSTMLLTLIYFSMPNCSPTSFRGSCFKHLTWMLNFNGPGTAPNYPQKNRKYRR